MPYPRKQAVAIFLSTKRRKGAAYAKRYAKKHGIAESMRKK